MDSDSDGEVVNLLDNRSDDGNEETLENNHIDESGSDDGSFSKANSDDEFEQTDDDIVDRDHCSDEEMGHQHRHGDQGPLQPNLRDDLKSSDETTSSEPESSDNTQPSSSGRSCPPGVLVEGTRDKRHQLHHGNCLSLPTCPEGKIESNEDPGAIGSDLQLHNQSIPGTSKSICPIGGTISTGTRPIKITNKQAIDLIQSVAQSGWDRTIDTQDDREIHVHLSKTEIKDSTAVTVGGNITVNPARRKPKNPPTKQSPQTFLQRLRVKTEKRIEEWTDGMVHTAATQAIIDKILQVDFRVFRTRICTVSCCFPFVEVKGVKLGS